MRLVLDTNLALSGLLWRGTPHRLLEAIRGQYPRIQLCSSPAMLTELTEVILRPTFSQQLHAIGRTAHQVLADYLEIIELIEPVETPRISRDPDDDHILACALAAKANAIVTGDNDLLVLKEYRDIAILSAAAALQRLSVGV